MRLTYRGKVYRIGFKHGQETNEIPGHGPTAQDFTIATIRTGERETDTKATADDSNILATAKVHRFHRDEHSHEAARKAALKAALKSVKTTHNFREAIWKTYHSRPGGISASQVGGGGGGGIPTTVTANAVS
jgi:hypothetical protein